MRTILTVGIALAATLALLLGATPVAADDDDGDGDEDEARLEQVDEWLDGKLGGWCFSEGFGLAGAVELHGCCSVSRGGSCGDCGSGAVSG